jgi:hypothetical protein
MIETPIKELIFGTQLRGNSTREQLLGTGSQSTFITSLGGNIDIAVTTH